MLKQDSKQLTTKTIPIPTNPRSKPLKQQLINLFKISKQEQKQTSLESSSGFRQGG